jgi:serine/threonine protein kinase/tetratricopeptide (TPR) repeat protein
MRQLPTAHPEPEWWAAFCRGLLTDPECSTLEAHIADCEQCRRVLETLPEDPLAGLVREAEFSAGTGHATVRLQPGYEILEEIGQGGMGVVYKARQAGLGRIVALKRLHAGRHGRPEVLARFHREAEAAARLDHPNIVQIYEFGEQDGQPYLALEYVDGGTLDRRLNGTPLPHRQAAELLETLARAMQVAHQQGIVHRDLKPSNVLLVGDKGQGAGGSNNVADISTTPDPRPLTLSPKITDFGLARLLDQQGGHTQTGDVIGTPSYMAPEQAGGQTLEVGPATDIYALGAILYEALTGRPPFMAATVLDTQEQARTREPVPPGRLQPQVPRDLETICLTCLHKEPHKRYACATDLAEDLRRFLAGEPVRARPVSLWQRAVKWARRRPTAAALVVLSGLAVAALVGGVWLHTAQLKAQVERAEASEALARKQRQRADTNYQQAREAINQMLDRLAKFHAPGVSKIDALRRELRQDVLHFYEGIARDDPDAGPSARFDMARAYVLMGELQAGEPARASLERGRQLLEELLAAEPANPDYQAELGRCWIQLGNKVNGQESAHCRKQALALFEALSRTQPDNWAWLRNLAVCHTNLGCCYEAEQIWTEAERHWREAIRILEEVTERHPQQDSCQYLLAISYSNLAVYLGNNGHLAEGLLLLPKAEAKLIPLVEAHPEARDWALGLAQTLWLWGAYLNADGRGQEARLQLNRAVQLAEELVRGDPSNRGLKEHLLRFVSSRVNNGTLLKRLDEAEADRKCCLDLATELNSWGDLCAGARFDAQAGAHALAAARADGLRTRQRLKPDDVYELVKAYALAAGAVRKHTQLPPAERTANAERYAASAMALLARLNADGYFKSQAHLRQLTTDDQDLESLRSRADFQKLLIELH